MIRNRLISWLVLLLGTGLLLFPCPSFAQTPPRASAPPTILINEFMSANRTGLEDEDGDHSDWIELYNPGPEVINLAGWSLTDSRNEPRLWVFPERLIEPDSYLVVFASDKDRRPTEPEAVLHTNFKLDAEGERLLLYAAGEPPRMVAGFSPRFPPQSPDVSFGLDPGSDQWRYFAEPTPGETNRGAETIQVGNELRLAIDSPKPDQVVEGQLAVMGTADTPDFQQRQLDLLLYGDASRAELLEYDAAPAPVVTRLAKLDTRDLPDGLHALRLRAVRSDGNYSETVVPFVVANGGKPDRAALSNSRSAITSPVADAMVDGIIDIAGMVSPWGTVKWDLLLLPGADDNAKVWLASGDTPGTFNVSFDTTQFADGAYALSLRVVKADASYDEYVVEFTVVNASP